MKLSHIPGSIRFQCCESSYAFLTTGDIYLFENDKIMINGFTGSKKEGSANNLWLRIYEDVCDIPAGRKPCVKSYPLLGISSFSALTQGENYLLYTGTVENISYSVTFKPFHEMWFWDISLKGDNRKVDIVYGQDLGMAEKSAVLENELYASQYLGHSVLSDCNGYHICSRQNMPQSGKHPYLCQGMLNTRTTGYSTDAQQFFGLSYKEDGVPHALGGDLENKNCQSEGSYVALQSETILLTDSYQFTFYGCFKSDHPLAVSELEFTDDIRKTYRTFCESGRPLKTAPVRVLPQFGTPFSSRSLTAHEIQRKYPDRLLEELDKDSLLSFFLPDQTHVVTKQKELLTERPHANIITTQADLTKVNNNLITSTNYMFGLFNAQTVIGNTSKHKFLSTSRGLLNLLKNSGQRIWVRIDGIYRLLAMPALFETGLFYARWLYEIGEDTLQITSFAVSDETKIVMQIESRLDISYDFIISNQLVMGTHEFQTEITLEESHGILRFYPEKGSCDLYPDLQYELYIPGRDYFFSDDRIFFEDGMPQNGTLLTLSLTSESSFQIILSGTLDGEKAASHPPADFTRELMSYQTYYNRLLNGFYLENEGYSGKEIQKLNVLSTWYAHNAMIHFAVPHGLEQPGGAAWGTRDVCQGPMEFFLATQHFELARDILLHLFSHQSKESGEWPQWFMFDRYEDCQQDCHGDVVFWPLKCVGDYLACTNDIAILNELLPYAGNKDDGKQTLSDHVKSAVSAVEKRYLEGTFLISYAGGDWDDTLQPADEHLKESMVSSWTQALASQVFFLLGHVLYNIDRSFADRLLLLARNMVNDFYRYLVIDGVIAGFAYRTEEGLFQPMLHPLDRNTGIHLRLLPLTRSIISGIADETLAVHSMELIEDRLHFPDGVRLMDRPAAYNGGVSRLFRRAEQAANVGREISLQYVHAHIRYIEALCRMGNANQAWHSLFEIIPIGLDDVVENASYRQSNLYYSSSDGDFSDRYEYSLAFDRLHDGTVAVKGGWRIYSSGPGIFLRRLICDILGIRAENEHLVIDPVLPMHMDGLRFHYQFMGTDYVFCYHILSEQPTVVAICQNGIKIPVQTVLGTYRQGGVCLTKDSLNPDCPELHIYMKS